MDQINQFYTGMDDEKICDGKQKKNKKGKSGGKLTQDQIRNLSTEELLSYIESQDKKNKAS